LNLDIFSENTIYGLALKFTVEQGKSHQNIPTALYLHSPFFDIYLLICLGRLCGQFYRIDGFEARNAPTPFRASSPRELLFYQLILVKLSMAPIDIQHTGAAVYLGIS
jgi:hypothetical protein